MLLENNLTRFDYYFKQYLCNFIYNNLSSSTHLDVEDAIDKFICANISSLFKSHVYTSKYNNSIEMRIVVEDIFGSLVGSNLVSFDVYIGNGVFSVIFPSLSDKIKLSKESMDWIKFNILKSKDNILSIEYLLDMDKKTYSNKPYSYISTVRTRGKRVFI